MSSHTLGRSNTYAGRHARQSSGDSASGHSALQDDEPDSEHHALSGPAGVRRHVSLNVPHKSTSPSGHRVPSKPRSATSSLTIDTANTQTKSRSNSPNQSSPLSRSPIAPNSLGRTPWSPTAEEAVKLIPNTSSSSHRASVENAREAFNRLDMAADQEHATQGLSSSTSSGSGKRLPPLTTSFAASGPASAGNVLTESPAPIPRGPSSAAAFIRPIGGFNPSSAAQSRMFEGKPNRNIPLHQHGAVTASVGTGASDWLKQKAMIAGEEKTASKWNDVDQHTTIDEESARTNSPPPPQEPSHIQQSQHPFNANAAAHQNQNLPGHPTWINNLHPAALAAYTAALNSYNTQQPPAPNSLWHSTSQEQPSPHNRPILSSLNTAGLMAPNTTQTQINGLYEGAAQQNGVIPSPLDVQSMALAKGWNPSSFDCRPTHAKFCVIKSYTEDDIHKSIKYEIWSSTKLGNQRLDRVFREGSPYGPVYLLFSVNGSGHFAGIAEMLTPVDESVSSNVWADSKWKGIFKLRWIYIKDVPNQALRHLRLANTPENKPVTSSRDTQEVPYDVGVEMLRIITSYQSRTSLLQDYSFYELKSTGFGQEDQQAS